MEDRGNTNPPSSVNPTPDRASEPYIGGADAVEKTTYSGDVHGTEAIGTNTSPGATATVRHGRGLGPLGWVVLVVALLVIVAYAAGLFT